MKIVLIALSLLVALVAGDGGHHHHHHQPHHHYPPPPPPTQQYFCQDTNITMKANVCVPNIDIEKKTNTYTEQEIYYKEQCYDQTTTVCNEVEKTVTKDVCYWEYTEKPETNPCSTVGIRDGEEQTISRKFIKCKESGFGSPGTGYGEHVVCGEEEATQTYTLKEVDEPINEMCTISYPVPKKTCEPFDYTTIEVVCEDVVNKVCVDVPQLRERNVTVEDTVLAEGEPNCKEVTLTKESKVCTEPVPVPPVKTYHHIPAPAVVPAYGK